MGNKEQEEQGCNPEADLHWSTQLPGPVKKRRATGRAQEEALTRDQNRYRTSITTVSVVGKQHELIAEPH